MSDELSVLERALERERRARRAAEQLLEHKSRELYHVNEDLRLTAAALRLEVKKAHAVLQNAAEAIITFDQKGSIQSVNPAAERVFQCAARRLIGKSITCLLPEESHEKFERPDVFFWTGPEGGDVSSRSTHGRRSDGAIFEMELSGSRVKVNAGWIYTWLLRDITERRNLERQLAFSQKMESVGQLAAGIAHEINTPIQYVGDNTVFLDKAFERLEKLLQTYDELLNDCRSRGCHDLVEKIERRKKRLKTDFLREEIPQAIQQTAEGAKRVAQIVTAMKEVSHPGSQQKTLVDLNAAIQSTVTISRNEWKYVAELELELDPSLPMVPGFVGDLNQAIVNLVVNAGHAIGEAVRGTDKGRITITTLALADCIEIRIEDSGIGMTPEVQERIFDPFFTTKAVGVGTGQGLSIVYSIIVDKHNGTIDVESKRGRGTTFTLRLPLCSDQHDGAPVNEVTANANTANPIRR